MCGVGRVAVDDADLCRRRPRPCRAQGLGGDRSGDVAAVLAAHAPNRVGLEAGPMSEWPHTGLARCGLEPVHVKTASASERRILLGACDTLVRRMRSRQQSAGLPRAFGLRPPRLLRERWRGAVRRLIAAHPMLMAAIDPILVARDKLGEELACLDRRDQARRRCRLPLPDDDSLCRRRRRAQLRRGDRRSGTVWQIEGCRAGARPHPEPLPIRRDRPAGRWTLRRDHDAVLEMGSLRQRRSHQVSVAAHHRRGSRTWRNRGDGHFSRTTPHPAIVSWRARSGQDNHCVAA